MGPAWTPERVDALRALFNKGLSTSQMAGELGITRNAVIGKLHRIGLVRGRPKAQPRPIRITRPRSAPRPNPNSGGFWSRLNSILRDADKAKELPIDSSPFAVSIEGLLNDRSQCRYPVTTPEGEAQLFCAADVVEGTPYCARHCAVCFRPARSLGTFQSVGDVIHRVVENLGQRDENPKAA